MAFDMTSYEMGRIKGSKSSTTVIEVDNSTFSYDSETKTGTLTMEGGGE